LRHEPKNKAVSSCFATAEEIAARGITAQEAEAGFTALGLQEGLYTEMMGEQALTQQQKVGAALGYDVEAQRNLLNAEAPAKRPFKVVDRLLKRLAKHPVPFKQVWV
jgi:hypothetical protein